MFESEAESIFGRKAQNSRRSMANEQCLKTAVSLASKTLLGTVGLKGGVDSPVSRTKLLKTEAHFGRKS
jgi:hypothetical protein